MIRESACPIVLVKKGKSHPNTRDFFPVSNFKWIGKIPTVVCLFSIIFGLQ